LGEPTMQPNNEAKLGAQLDRVAFQRLLIPEVSYRDYVTRCGGDLDAVRALSRTRLEVKRGLLMADHCGGVPEYARYGCGRPVYAIDFFQDPSGPAYHQECWRKATEQKTAERAARPYVLWPYHVHGSDWAGVDGTIAAKTADEARARVLDWVQREYGLPGPDWVGGGDELGLYVQIGEPQPPLGADEIAALFGVRRQTVDNWRQRKTAGFPPPDLTVSGRPLWWSHTVQAWGHKTGRLPIAAP
jgi:hypothetical protein